MSQDTGFMNSYGNGVAVENNGEIVNVNRLRFISLAATTGSFFLTSVPGAGVYFGLGAFMLSPSLGSLYVRDMGRFWAGVGTRLVITGGGGLAVLGTVAYCWDRGCSYQETVGAIALLSLGVHMLYDIFFLSSRAVREHNEQVRSNDNVSIAPWIHPDTGSAGMSVSISF